MTVREIDVEKNQVSLYLEMPFSETNAVISAWTGLKERYDKLGATSMEEVLFYKGAFFMQLGFEQFNVQVYYTYDKTVSQAEAFYKAIYYENEELAIDTSLPRSKIEEVVIEIPDLEIKGGLASERLEKTWSKDVVFDKIEKCAASYFLAPSKKVEGRVPKFEVIPNRNTLQFYLTKEVVDNASNIWCPLIKLFYDDCNHYPREWLLFTISYERKGSEVILTIEVDGRVGSGIFENARRGSYINIEVEHEAEMERYAQKMAEYFRQCLE